MTLSASGRMSRATVGLPYHDSHDSGETILNLVRPSASPWVSGLASAAGGFRPATPRVSPQTPGRPAPGPSPRAGASPREDPPRQIPADSSPSPAVKSLVWCPGNLEAMGGTMLADLASGKEGFDNPATPSGVPGAVRAAHEPRGGHVRERRDRPPRRCRRRPPPSGWCRFGLRLRDAAGPDVETGAAKWPDLIRQSSPTPIRLPGAPSPAAPAWGRCPARPP